MTFKQTEKIVEVDGVMTIDVAEIAIRFLDGMSGVSEEYPPGHDFAAMLNDFAAYRPEAAQAAVKGAQAVVEHLVGQIAKLAAVPGGGRVQ